MVASLLRRPQTCRLPNTGALALGPRSTQSSRNIAIAVGKPSRGPKRAQSCHKVDTHAPQACSRPASTLDAHRKSPPTDHHNISCSYKHRLAKPGLSLFAQLELLMVGRAVTSFTHPYRPEGRQDRRPRPPPARPRQPARPRPPASPCQSRTHTRSTLPGGHSPGSS